MHLRTLIALAPARGASVPISARHPDHLLYVVVEDGLDSSRLI